MKRDFLDLVIGGPDMSGTSTQIGDVMKYFEERGRSVRDIRGTEIDALFHAEEFGNFNKCYRSYGDFRDGDRFDSAVKKIFLEKASGLLIGGGTNEDLRVASMVDNGVSSYVNPDLADIWVMEEPTKRGAGQVCRAIEQMRSKYGSSINGKAAAETHSVYRTDEFLRFREPLRKTGKVIVRSRSEESACYQMRDEEILPSGVSRDYYFNLEGHKIAFANPPSHIFVVCGPENWKREDYLALKKERSGGRLQDDHEANVDYQIMVNNRYAGEWLNNLYKEGCGMHGGVVPEIARFSVYDSKSEIREKMALKLNEILG